MDDRRCFLFTGGGTGGHITPGLAVAQMLRTRLPGSRIVFAGAGRAVELKLLANEEFRALPVEPMRRLLSHPLKFLWSNASALSSARVMLAELMPAAVIGLGGFASLPVLLAAWRQGIPRVLLEQNVLPGRANRFASRFASAVCTSFPETNARLHRRAHVILTGNPVRDEIARWSAEPDFRGRAQPWRAQPRILVLGGSLGARPINSAIRQILIDDAAWCRRVEWVHQTGPDDLAELTDAYRTAEVTAHVAPFLSDMAEQLPRASLVISRAGATTLAELACAGVPAIVIPYPQSTDRHQDLNADAYARVGAARVVAQASPGTTLAARLFAGLRDLFDHPHEIESMRAAMRRQARPDAAQCVVDVIAHLCGPGNDPE